MKQFSLLFILLFSTIIIKAQEESSDSTKYWKFGGNSSFTFSQVSLNNWAAGGEEAIAGTYLLKTHLNYKKKKVAWDNDFDFGYGLSKQSDYKASKTEDKLQFASKLGYEAHKYWYYSTLVDFKTQLASGFKDPLVQEVEISKWMSPGYLTLSLGMDFKRSDNFSVYISPVTGKMTFVTDDSLSFDGAYGVEPGENLRSEFGGYLKAVLKKSDIIKNVDFSTKLELFTNYSEKPENVDVDWETIINMKVNSYLTAMFKFNLLFDDDTKYIDDDGVEHGARVQTKQILGFGLAYKFGS